MRDPRTVRFVEGLGNFVRVSKNCLYGQGAASGRRSPYDRWRALGRLANALAGGPSRQSIGERLALEQLHHEVFSTVVATYVVDGADIRMGECRDRARFAFEATAPLRVRREL